MLFMHNGLGIELVIDRRHPVGASDPAGIADVILESALTTIVDLEVTVTATGAIQPTTQVEPLVMSTLPRCSQAKDLIFAG